jgi:N-acetylmuramoyl-L-alanine amidase
LNPPLRKRGLWGAPLALIFLAAFAPPATARAHHSESWAREHFVTAERMREALNGRPPAERTRRDYQRVLNAYRSVYMGAPSSAKADPSVVAVAETLVEMGRRFDDDKVLSKAIDQYKFLRREYPGSKYRFDGLFTIGEIYKDDLNDPVSARATFQDFLHRYPHNRLADGAKQAIVELNQQALAEKASEAQKSAAKKETGRTAKKTVADIPAEAGAGSASSTNDDSTPRDSGVPRVTGIRHWSTPDYTRVAIDVEADVKFSSQRIGNPARIFFDLRDTKLASTLVGKSFDVDDGFLKKVRVAQFAPGRTRVVLEVDNLSSYDAFLLPDPYRLIIDIHGKNGRTKKTVAVEDASGTPKSVEANKALAKVETKPADGEPTPDTKDVVDSGVSEDEAAPAPPALQSENQPQVAIVKKIVDADDEPSTDAAGDKTGKRNIRGTKKAAAQAGADPTDKKSESDADATNSAGASFPRNVPDSHAKANSRSLSSSKSGNDWAMREARPTSSGDRSLIRALGLKIGKIVIDAGHGGHDTGTIGPNGLEEKDLVLEVGRRLGKLLETRLGAEVVYTRKDDTFIPLETRTAIANQARADLFVSIHANSSHDPDARGVETYYLNFTSSPEALDVAARENAVSEKSIYELQDLVKKIALKEKIEESREFAGDVQASLHSGLAVKSPAIRDRGVKKAPFIVLIGANMPSILAEISFVSNPTDERRLATGEYRERIAESLYKGIARYVNGLSGVKVASKMDKNSGQ